MFAIMLFSLIAGGIAGSIVNVIATRLPAETGLSGPPLRTGTTEESRRQLVPVIGPIDPVHGVDWPNFATQLGAIAITVASLAFYGFSLAAFQAAALSLVLLTILRIDWQHHSIYIITIWPGILLALLFALLHSPSRLLSASIAGAAAALVFLLLFFLAIAIYRRRALGFGDVLLAGLIGTMVGLEWVTHAIILGMILAAAGGIFLVAIKVKKRTDYIPYGAYLSLGAMVVVMITA